jgi:YidC/Oxa1 family membrane protein insertase
LVFWIFSNLFTLVQQLALNKVLAKKRAVAVALEEREPVIAPKRKKRR